MGVHLRKFKFATDLARLGLKNEIWSLFICVLVGFVWAFLLIALSYICNGEGALIGYPEWPTAEMQSRGEEQSLASGTVIAFASGVGVALSVVGDFTSAIIGVAISASLLPPAVNCGMLWAYAICVAMDPNLGWGHSPAELATMGALSITLTILNIILVFLASLMMFIAKDVTLNTSRGFDDNNRQIKALAISAFKEKFDDAKIRGKSKKRLPHKRAGRYHVNRAVDTQLHPVGLKKTLIAHNTTRRIPNVQSKAALFDTFGNKSGRTLGRYSTELHGDNYSDFHSDFGSEDEYTDSEEAMDGLPSDGLPSDRAENKESPSSPSAASGFFKQVSSSLRTMVHRGGHSKLSVLSDDDDDTLSALKNGDDRLAVPRT